MSLQLKLTLQKIKNIKRLILISVSIVIVAFVLGLVIDSCGFRHVEIITELNLYEKSLDPDVCYALVEKINSFNLDCFPEVEIIDCG